MDKPVVHIYNATDMGDYLVGWCDDHPRFPEGSHVRTSLIVDRRQRMGDLTIETLNTHYKVVGDLNAGS